MSASDPEDRVPSNAGSEERRALVSSVVEIDEPLPGLEPAEVKLAGCESVIGFFVEVAKGASGARAVGVRRGGVSDDGVEWWSGCSVLEDERWRSTI